MRSGYLLKLLATAIGGSLVATVPANAADPAKADSAQPIKNDTGKRICKMVIPTGSRFGSRVCKTVDEWRHDEEQTQNQIDEGRRGNNDLTPPR